MRALARNRSKKGELILEIEGINTKNIDLKTARSLIKGGENDKLKLLMKKMVKENLLN